MNQPLSPLIEGMECYLGNALDVNVVRWFIDDDLIFFGPPLSEDCDGHRLVSFDELYQAMEIFPNYCLEN